MFNKLVILLSVFISQPVLATTHIIDNGYTRGDFPFGRYSNMVLDSSGFPVISFTNSTFGSLYVIHCNDVNCEGGDDIANTVISGLGGTAFSYGLDLDSNGFPVMSFYDTNNTDLMLIRCNDANCSEAATPTTITNADDIGKFNDMVLDISDNPVISYFNDTTNDLIVYHCSNNSCLNGTFNTVGNFSNGVGVQSIQLDTSGFPVIAISGDFRPRLIRCQDINCAGSSIEQLDTAYAPNLAMKLDSNDFPVVAYVENGGPTKIIHCDDVACDPAVNGDETGVQISTSTSDLDLALDSSGRPVIVTTKVGKYNFIFCNDVNCSGNNEFETQLTYSGSFQVGLTIDSSGNPLAVAYTSSGIGGNSSGVNVLHCNDSLCQGDNESANYLNMYKIDVGQHSKMVKDGSGYNWSYYDATNKDLRFRHCDNLPCITSESIEVVDDVDDVGQYNSLALDNTGNPFIAYYDATNAALMTADCNNPSCSSASLFTVDSPNVGTDISVVVDSSGFPIISYFDLINQVLKLARCAVTSCVSFDNEINIVSPLSPAGQYTSLALDPVTEYPLISFFDFTQFSLRLAQCNDDACDETVNGPENIQIVDDDPINFVGFFSSMQLDASGFPVISYYDSTDGALKLAHCGNADCSSNNSAVIVDDGNGNQVGSYSSLYLDTNGIPVISYYDSTNQDLLLAKCINANCSGFVYKTIAASAGDVGQYSSLFVEGDTAYISYYNATEKQLEVVDVFLPDIIFADGFE